MLVYTHVLKLDSVELILGGKDELKTFGFKPPTIESQIVIPIINYAEKLERRKTK